MKEFWLSFLITIFYIVAGSTTVSTVWGFELPVLSFKLGDKGFHFSYLKTTPEKIFASGMSPGPCKRMLVNLAKKPLKTASNMRRYRAKGHGQGGWYGKNIQRRACSHESRYEYITMKRVVEPTCLLRGVLFAPTYHLRETPRFLPTACFSVFAINYVLLLSYPENMENLRECLSELTEIG